MHVTKLAVLRRTVSARYNLAMPPSSDPYELLGVEPDADLQTLRRAYRRAALACHPDNCRGDPAAAERRFLEVVKAYRIAQARLLRREGVVGADALRPQDFARAEDPWHFEVHWEGAFGRRGPRRRPNAQRVVLATRDENRLFAVLLAGSAAGAVAVAVWLARTGAFGRTAPDGPAWPHAAAAATAVGVYAVGVAASVLTAVLTRRVVWLVRRLGLLARRLLPARAARRLP